MIVSGATAASSRIGLITNVKVQTTTRALSSQLAPSALLSSVVPRVPLNGCSSTGRVHSLSSTSLSRLHLTPDNAEWGGIKRQLEEAQLPALIPVENADLILQVHGFSERANWLVPGRILLGKYPGQIPSDLPMDWQNARERVREIVLRGGATDFLSLQAELPPQADESKWSAPADKTDDGVFFSGFRSYRADALAAVAKGQEARNGQPPEEAAVSAAAGLTFHHFPIPDLSPAENMAVLSGLVDDLELLVTAGKVLFIHCWAGRGRTGLIAACLLGKLYPHVGAEQALNRVDAYYRCRGTVAVGKASRVSPETEEQEDQVRLFFEQVLKR